MTSQMELIPGLPNDVARECLLRVPFHSFPSLLTISKAWNSEIQSPYFHHSRRLTGLTRPVFVLAQRHRVTHSLSIRIFDPGNRRFGSCSRLPDLPLEGRAFSGLVRGGDTDSSVIVMSCGWRRLGDGELRFAHVAHVFDFLTGQWRRAADVPSHPDMWYGLGACADPSRRKVLVVGGYGGQSRALRSALMYDVAEDKWTCLDDMAKPRQSASVVFHAGKFHVVGGFGAEFSPSQITCAESLDPEKLEWGSVNEGFLKEGEDGSTFVTVNEDGDGDLYCSVGKSVRVRRGGGDSATWEEVARVPRDEAWCKKGVVTWKGKMLVLGAELSHVGPQHNYLLDLKTCKWSKVDGDCDDMVIEFGCGMDL